MTPPTTADTAVIEKIAELEKTRYQAMQDGDVTTLVELLSDDLVYSHTNGSRDSKQIYLEKVGTTLDYLEIDHPVDSVLVSENHVFIHGTMAARARRSGVEILLDNACLSVWRREAAGWRFLAFQPTPRKTT